MEFGGKFRMVREARGLKQAELARKLGVSPATINDYEAGRRTPHLKFLPEIAAALEVKATLFLDEEAFEHLSERMAAISAAQKAAVDEALGVVLRATAKVRLEAGGESTPSTVRKLAALGVESRERMVEA